MPRPCRRCPPTAAMPPSAARPQPCRTTRPCAPPPQVLIEQCLLDEPRPCMCAGAPTLPRLSSANICRAHAKIRGVAAGLAVASAEAHKPVAQSCLQASAQLLASRAVEYYRSRGRKPAARCYGGPSEMQHNLDASAQQRRRAEFGRGRDVRPGRDVRAGTLTPVVRTQSERHACLDMPQRFLLHPQKAHAIMCHLHSNAVCLSYVASMNSSAFGRYRADRQLAFPAVSTKHHPVTYKHSSWVRVPPNECLG